MTKIFNHSAHKRLWKWLAENPTKSKWHWPEWKGNGGIFSRVEADCFACDCTARCHINSAACPLIWPLNGEGQLLCTNGGLWDEWDNIESCYSEDEIENMSDEDKAERTRLALLIMNLPVKDGIKYV